MNSLIIDLMINIFIIKCNLFYLIKIEQHVCMDIINTCDTILFV